MRFSNVEHVFIQRLCDQLDVTHYLPNATMMMN
jgi:hypothetical protein